MIADEIHEQLCAAEVPHAMIDLDHLSSAWPRHSELPFRNLSTVWANYREDGINRLVLATMLRSRDDLDGIRDSIPSSVLTVCLVRASNATIDARLRGRHVGSDLEGHLSDSIRFASILEAAGFEDFAIENEGLGVPKIAADILNRVGWTPSGS